MKILVRIGKFPTKSETFIVNHIVMMIKEDFDVNILANSKLHNANSSQSKIFEDYNLQEKTFEIEDFDLTTYFKKIKFIVKAVYKNNSLFKYLKTFNFFKYGKEGVKGRLFYKIFQIKDFLKFDVVHVQFGVHDYPFVELKKHNLIKSKLVVTFHGHDAHFNTVTFLKRKQYYKDLFKYSDIVTVNTNYLKYQIIELGCKQNKIKVMPMPVDTDYFVPNPKRENKLFSILTIGRLIDLKGHIYGIRAISKLINKGYNVNYTIIGEGEECLKLQEEIEKLKINKHVNLLGLKDQHFIKDEMQKTDLFLMTSVTDSAGRRETQGVVTIEAQACGLPVVAFKSGGVPFTIENDVTGFLCQEFNVDEMTNKIEYFINNENVKIRMGHAARKFVVNNFSNSYMSKNWKELYYCLDKS